MVNVRHTSIKNCYFSSAIPTDAYSEPRKTPKKGLYVKILLTPFTAPTKISRRTAWSL